MSSFPFIDLNKYFSYEKLQVWGIALPQNESSLDQLKEELKLKYGEGPQRIGVKKWPEHCSGRLCAAFSMKKLGVAVTWPIKLESGAPDWDSLVTGSISHSKSIAMAVVAKSTDYSSIGCDIEEVISEKRLDVIKKMILVDSENDLLEGVSDEDSLWFATLLFSAKESLYKMINPLAKVYLNFSEGVVREVGERSFVIELISEKQELSKFCGSYHGQFSLIGDNLMTLLTYQKQQ